MVRRLYFPLVGLFWVVMNVLLWRSELGGLQDGGTPVPAATVFDRILTAPDDSSLVIFRNGKRLGSCHWLPTVQEETPEVVSDEDFAPEGRVGRITGYEISLDGSAAILPGSARHLRFQWRIEFGPDKQWCRLSLRLVRRPDIWEMNADAAAERLELRGDTESDSWERAFRFAELENPRTLFRALGGPFAAMAAGGMLAGLPGATPHELALGVRWEASQDWMRIAHARTRVYRLRARLFADQRIEVLLSRVGEILRVDLPGNIRLVNEGFAGLLGTGP